MNDRRQSHRIAFALVPLASFGLVACWTVLGGDLQPVPGEPGDATTEADVHSTDSGKPADARNDRATLDATTPTEDGALDADESSSDAVDDSPPPPPPATVTYYPLAIDGGC